ncbi:Hsp20/alpha crystallin family protein [Piscinibacter defluvii]|uniref:Hsp20/alpha crystallin family protein n=1 Tax=Piscinibacter defluvii TaxID=1796922 RepID=UPI000FDDF191|nr:Hsp20/alpha crystallin family protein [Piscinibacter defluvii]
MYVLPLAYPLPRRAFHPAWARRTAESAPLRPAMDASETDTAYTLTFDLPGLTREQVNVTVTGQLVSVEAAASEANAADGSRVLHRERRVPRFARRIELPLEIDAEAAQARFADGVLTLTLPKKPRGGTRNVQVQ